MDGGRGVATPCWLEMTWKEPAVHGVTCWVTVLRLILNYQGNISWLCWDPRDKGPFPNAVAIFYLFIFLTLYLLNFNIFITSLTSSTLFEFRSKHESYRGVWSLLKMILVNTGMDMRVLYCQLSVRPFFIWFVQKFGISTNSHIWWYNIPSPDPKWMQVSELLSLNFYNICAILFLLWGFLRAVCWNAVYVGHLTMAMQFFSNYFFKNWQYQFLKRLLLSYS